MSPRKLFEAIAADFIRPTSARLSEQLKRTIDLSVQLKIDNKTVHRQVVSAASESLPRLFGLVRIRVSSASKEDQYKFILQCVLSNKQSEDCVSGFRTNGFVTLGFNDAITNHAGCTYAHKDWYWQSRLLDF